MKGKGLFVTGTGTDVGKTYVTGLLVKKLVQAGCKAGYYKAAISGADTVEESDAGYVKSVSGISQDSKSLVSYLYPEAVSPHLAAKINSRPVEPEQVQEDYRKVRERFDYVTVEGSGGIVCPIRWDGEKKLLLEDIIRLLELPVLLVADSGLGTINSTVLTVEYLRQKEICIKGIILNHFDGSPMQEDNRNMIQELTGIPVVAVVGEDDRTLQMDTETLLSFYE